MIARDERAYRRGALQSVQFLKRLLDGCRPEDAATIIADWEQQLILGRESQEARYLGEYCDICVAEFNRRRAA